MLLGKPGLDGLAVRVESGYCGGGRLAQQVTWCLQEEQQAADCGQDCKMCRMASLHELHPALSGPDKQCMEPHTATLVAHGVSD